MGLQNDDWGVGEIPDCKRGVPGQPPPHTHLIRPTRAPTVPTRAGRGRRSGRWQALFGPPHLVPWLCVAGAQALLPRAEWREELTARRTWGSALLGPPSATQTRISTRGTSSRLSSSEELLSMICASFCASPSLAGDTVRCSACVRSVLLL